MAGMWIGKSREQVDDDDVRDAGGLGWGLEQEVEDVVVKCSFIFALGTAEAVGEGCEMCGEERAGDEAEERLWSGKNSVVCV